MTYAGHLPQQSPATLTGQTQQQPPSPLPTRNLGTPSLMVLSCETSTVPGVNPALTLISPYGFIKFQFQSNVLTASEWHILDGYQTDCEFVELKVLKTVLEEHISS